MHPRASDQFSARLPLWLGIALTAIVVMNGATVIGTIVAAQSAETVGLPLSFPLILRVAHAGFWVIVISAIFVELLRARRWAFRWLAPTLTLYAASQWGWQAAFARADFDRGRLPFLALVSALLLIPVWGYWLVRRAQFSAPPARSDSA